jgi:hypothetical protein
VTPFRRRGSWLIAVVGFLAVLTYGVARGLDEPVRQYMEREVNRLPDARGRDEPAPDYRGSKGQPGPIAAFFFWMMSPAYFSR